MKETALRVLRSVFGLPSWQVRWDSQVGLDMNFGAPRLEIHGPRVPPDKSPRVRALFARRSVHLLGSHWLCIEPGCWLLELSDGTIVRDTSPLKELNRAVSFLDGEKLEGFRIDARTGTTLMHFDLGARVVIRASSSNENESELWSLSNSSHVVEVYAGGSYRFGSVRRSLDANHSLTSSSDECIVVARTAKGERALRKDPRAVAV